MKELNGHGIKALCGVSLGVLGVGGSNTIIEVDQDPLGMIIGVHHQVGSADIYVQNTSLVEVVDSYET